MNKLLNRLQLKKINIAYYGIPINDLVNPVKKFLKRLRSSLWRNGIIYYHPEKRKLYNILNEQNTNRSCNKFLSS